MNLYQCSYYFNGYYNQSIVREESLEKAQEFHRTNLIAQGFNIPEAATIYARLLDPNGPVGYV